ncbi:NUDIX domain-containing protein [Kitasatospora sp. NPDC001540]|uniref:NUDIX domain-containing protein n=1 Tax=Kitasatospora sp. NPDC001540 TaxID=3364014 RepID=UPI0036D17302
MSTTDEHPAPPAEQRAGHGASAEVRELLEAHAAPLLGAHALLRDAAGLLLVVDRGREGGWDLPGGPTGNELPADALARHLREAVGVEAGTGRLLVVDTAPADRRGRPLLDLLFAAHVTAAADPGATGPTGIRWVGEARALELLGPAAAARLRAALGAEKGSHTALLDDGELVTPSKRDYYRQLPSPMMAATVLVRDDEGRVLVLEPTYKAHLELVGGMVEADEVPVEAAEREGAEELGLRRRPGRLLVVDNVPARLTSYGRALVVHVFDLPPLSADEVAALVLDPKEVRSARWLPPHEALDQLPHVLAVRLAAALRALEHGTVEVLEHADTASLADPARGDAQ